MSGIASWGVEKISKGLTDDVNKALEGFRTQNRTHHLGKQFNKAEKDEKQEVETTLNRESEQKIKDILEDKLSTIADVPLLSRAIKRPIVIYKNGKVFDTIGSEFPGEPLHISHTPEGVGHWAPYDTSIKVEASADNNCLHDTAMVLLGTKACQEIGIKTAADLRNLEVKEITNNPALANQLMKEAAKLSILKPTAMMQGGREYNFNILSTNSKQAFTSISNKGDDEDIDYYNAGHYEIALGPNGQPLQDEQGNLQKVFVIDKIIDFPRKLGSANIFRVYQTPHSTISLGNVPANTCNNDVSFVGLEPKGPSTHAPRINQRIPATTYNLRYHSTKNFPNVFNIFNTNPVDTLRVDECRKILGHLGTNYHNTKGCYLVGSSYERLAPIFEKEKDPETGQIIINSKTGKANMIPTMKEGAKEQLLDVVINPSSENLKKLHDGFKESGKEQKGNYRAEWRIAELYKEFEEATKKVEEQKKKYEDK